MYRQHRVGCRASSCGNRRGSRRSLSTFLPSTLQVCKLLSRGPFSSSTSKPASFAKQLLKSSSHCCLRLRARRRCQHCVTIVPIITAKNVLEAVCGLSGRGSRAASKQRQQLHLTPAVYPLGANATLPAVTLKAVAGKAQVYRVIFTMMLIRSGLSLCRVSDPRSMLERRWLSNVSADELCCLMRYVVLSNRCSL